MSNLPSRSIAILGLTAALALAACAGAVGTARPFDTAPSPVPAPPSAGSATSSPASAGSSPAASLPADAIPHPTGPTDVVLRVGLKGGFIRVETLMARTPLFTLYGDGRVLIAADDPSGGGLNPGAAGGVTAGVPMREARLDEDQVQALLAHALTERGLGLAREAYLEGGIMDAPTTVFEIHAGGVDKAVAVSALSTDPAPGPDATAIRGFATLLDELRGIGTTADYAAPAFVAVIAETEPDPAAASAPWPWPDLAPADFATPVDTDPLPFPRHLLTEDELAAVGDETGPGGVGGLRYRGPDGRDYLVVIRPALPDEVAAAG